MVAIRGDDGVIHRTRRVNDGMLLEVIMGRGTGQEGLREGRKGVEKPLAEEKGTKRPCGRGRGCRCSGKGLKARQIKGRRECSSSECF